MQPLLLHSDDILEIVSLRPVGGYAIPGGGQVPGGRAWRPSDPGGGQAGMDIEYSRPIVFFRWASCDEGDEVSGSSRSGQALQRCQRIHLRSADARRRQSRTSPPVPDGQESSVILENSLRNAGSDKSGIACAL